MLALLVFALVACNPDGGTGGGSQGGGGLDDATYSVFFDTDGGHMLNGGSAETLTGVKYGSKIENPGSPTKPGYTFKYWSKGGEEFDFATDVITGNTTLTAEYTPNEYEPVIKLYDENYGKYGSVQGQVNPYEDGDITLAQNGDGETGRIVVQYGSDKPVEMVIPQSNDEDDRFVYWYYYDTVTEKDDNGEDVTKTVIVPFTEWAEKDTASEDITLAEKYTFLKGEEPVLYPMFHSQLPDVTVTFDANGGTFVEPSVSLKENDFIYKSVMDGLGNPEREGYEFLYWYYETTDKDDVVTETEFVFYDDVTEGADNKTAAKVTYDITLKAKWVKKVSVSSVSDFDAVRAALAGDDEELRAEYLNAHITLSADLTLCGWTPLYDKDNMFVGVFDGGSHTITITPAVGDCMTFIGASNGRIENLKIEFKLPAADFSSVSVQDIYIGGIVGYNAGVVNACDAEFAVGESGAALQADGLNLVIGGIAAETARGSEILNCTVRAGIYVSGGTIRAGGIAGSAKGVISSCSAVISAAVSATGTVYLGGIGGALDSAQVEKCGVDASAGIAASGKDVYVGSVAGSAKAGAVKECYTSATAVISAEGYNVMAGGILGYNESAISDCRADITLSAKCVGGNVRAGGAAGYSLSTGGSRGNISSCYVTGSVEVNADGGAVVSAGGIVGETGSSAVNKTLCEVSVTVSNDSGSSNVGYFVGKTLAGKSEFGKDYYASGNALTLNGVEFDPSSETPAFEVTAPKEGVSSEDGAKFTDKAWIFAADGINFDQSKWQVTDDGRLVLAVETEEA